MRRAGFNSVVVIEQRGPGVLLAIAGRRDDVRVYALEEVKKAVEWRVDVEIRRQKERLHREEAKKGMIGGVDKVFESYENLFYQVLLCQLRRASGRSLQHRIAKECQLLQIKDAFETDSARPSTLRSRRGQLNIYIRSRVHPRTCPSDARRGAFAC